MHEILLRRCEIKYVRYILVRGSRDELIKSCVVAFTVSFAFSKPITHFFANSFGVTERCISFLIFAYLFSVIETLMFPIILPTMRFWVNPIETFSIALSKSWMAMSSWIYVTCGAQGVWLLTWLVDLRLNTLLFCYSLIEYILKICFDGS